MLIFGIILKIDPEFLNQWSLENLSQIFILGIPLEELVWAYLIGALWAAAYDKINNYKLVKLPAPDQQGENNLN